MRFSQEPDNWLHSLHCRLFHGFEAAVNPLERRAHSTIDACEQRQHERARQQRRGKPLYSSAQRLRRARAACDPAIALYDDVALLLEWLGHDILSVAEPAYAERCPLYDFVTAELLPRVALCPHLLEPVPRTLKNGRQEFLAFAKQLDEDLSLLGAEFQCPAELLRGVLQMLSRDDCDPLRWQEERVLRQQLRGRFHDVCEAVAELRKTTIRASSLVENLNSRLRGYFFLRRQLGADYLSLLQFFFNHRPLERSHRPKREGKTPAQLLTGQPHPHWLNMLGFNRFQRS